MTLRLNAKINAEGNYDNVSTPGWNKCRNALSESSSFKSSNSMRSGSIKITDLTGSYHKKVQSLAAKNSKINVHKAGTHTTENGGSLKNVHISVARQSTS